MTQEESRLLREVHERQTVVIERLSRVHHDLYGNGQPGLIAEVGEVSANQEHCPARAAFSEGGQGLRHQRYATYLAVAAICLSALTSALAIAGPVIRYVLAAPPASKTVTAVGQQHGATP